MSKSVTQEISNEVGDVLEDVVHSLRKMAKHLKADAGDALSEAATSLTQAALDLAEEAKAQSKAVVRKTGQEMRQHPAATAAVAAAAAALIGLLLMRRGASTD